MDGHVLTCVLCDLYHIYTDYVYTVCMKCAYVWLYWQVTVCNPLPDPLMISCNQKAVHRCFFVRIHLLFLRLLRWQIQLQRSKICFTTLMLKYNIIICTVIKVGNTYIIYTCNNYVRTNSFLYHAYVYLACVQYWEWTI